MAKECSESATAMEPGAGMVRGQVHDASNDAPLANASVTAQWVAMVGSGERKEVTATSDASGRYAICGIPSGRPVVVRGEHAKRFTDARSVQIKPAGVSILDLRMEPAGADSNRP